MFSARAGIGLGVVTLGIKRMVAPALPIRALPKIDLILLSHAHMDHFDLPSLRRLANRDTTVITGLIALYKALGGGWESFPRE